MPARVGLLGRDQELSELDGLLDDAGDGRRQLALVCGDAGIGKTAVVDAMVHRAAGRGMATAWGRCWEGGGGAPFWPWVQAVRSCVSQVDDETLATLGPRLGDLAQLAPEVDSRISGDAPQGGSEGPDARVRLFDAVATFLAVTAAGAGGLVVALDDLHAADEGSLQLLRYVMRQPAPARLVVVGTYRITEVLRSPAHQQLLGAVSRYGPTLRLRGLEPNDVGALLRRTGSAKAAGAAREVHEVTDGNPFLVYQAARLLSDGRKGSAVRVRLPADARALIRRRLEPLEVSQREALVGAAVLGREFDVAILASVLGRDTGSVLDVLGGAGDLAVVEEVSVGRWSFTHALLHEGLLEGLQARKRTELHQRAGEMLLSIHGADDGPELARIAHHMYEAARGGGDAGPAVELCQRAAAMASATFAYEEAASWLQRALDALALTDPVDERCHYHLLLALAEATSRCGDMKEAAALHQRAIRAARAFGSVELAAEAAVQAAPFAISDSVVIGALDDALCDLPDEDSPLRARVLVSFARVLQASNIGREVLQDISRQGLEMARRLGDPETQWWTLWQWHQSAFHRPGTLAERRCVAEELADIAQRSGSLERQQLARGWRVANLLEDGHLARARAETEAAVRDAERLRQPLQLWSSTAMLTSIALAEGRLDDAERLAERGLALGQDLDWPHADVVYRSFLMMLRRHQGRFEELERLATDALNNFTVTAFDCGRQFPLMLCLINKGQGDEVRLRLEKLIGSGVEELVGFTGPDGEWVDAMRLCCPTAVGELCWLLDDAARAHALYDRILPHAGVHIVIGEGESHGVTDRHLGQLATLLGRFDDADLHFHAAHRLHDLMGTAIWGAHGRVDHARMLARRGGPADEAHAHHLLQEALATYRRLGLSYCEEQARRFLDALDGTTAQGVRLRREGEYWSVERGATVVHLRDSKGLRYLARLVESPGKDLHALDLVVGEARGTRSVEPELDVERAGGDAGAVLDSRAKEAYRRRLEDLQRHEGAVTSEDVQREIVFLETELIGAVGLGGRDRRAASDAERARQSVTKAIREALDRLSDADPALGGEVRAAVRTGTFSSYSPEGTL